MKAITLAACAVLLAGCAATPAQKRAMAEGIADGMQRQSEAYNRAAEQTPVYVPRRTQCWRNGQYVTCW